MPTYLPPRRGVTLSEAYAEAAAVAPATYVMLNCYELWHPTMAEPARVVNDHAPLLATLEATAPRNAEEEVEFLSAQVTVTRPEESDAAGSPGISMTISNVSGVLSAALAAARGSLLPWEVIERVYASHDTSGPARLPPLKLYLTNADIGGATATLTAGLGDPCNISIPALTFTVTEYPGLAAQ